MKIEIVKLQTDMLEAAKLRGFRKGCRYRDVGSEGKLFDCIRTAMFDPQYYDNSKDIMLGHGDGLIYNNGHWGELISDR